MCVLYIRVSLFLINGSLCVYLRVRQHRVHFLNDFFLHFSATSCCEPLGFGLLHPPKLKCGMGFDLLLPPVKFAVGCHCRPCFASVATVDMQLLRDLLKQTAIMKKN